MLWIWSATVLIPLGHLDESGTRWPVELRDLVLQQSSITMYSYPRSLRPREMNLFAVSRANFAEAALHWPAFWEMMSVKSSCPSKKNECGCEALEKTIPHPAIPP